MTRLPRIYLDHAATSWPKLPAALDAADEFMRECGATSGRGAYTSARQADQWVTAARHNLAQLLGARNAADVALCSSGTHALNAAISGLLRPGDTVVTTAIDHNSVLRPLEYWRKNLGVRLVIAPSDSTGLARLPEEIITPAPRLVIVSHASNVTGRIQDLSTWSQLAHQYGATLIVDASQTVGYVPIDMRRSGIDVLVAAGHKGLRAMSGTGFVIASHELQQQFEPLMRGGTGSSSESLDAEPMWPQSIEVGNLNLPAIVSMAAAAEHWLREGATMESWREPLAHFVAGARQRLTREQLIILGHEEDAGYLPVVSVLLSGWDIHDAAAVLDANYGIEARAGYHCAALAHQYLQSYESGGTLRFSLGHATTHAELDTTLHALTEMLNG